METTTIETTYYAVAKLMHIAPDSPQYPVEMKLPTGCVGMLLVFDSLEAALEFAGEDGEPALRPLRVKVTAPNA